MDSESFPAIKPSSRSFDIGSYPEAVFEAQNGAKSYIRYGNKRVNANLTLSFSNITDQVRSLVQSGAFTDKEVEIHLAYFDTNESIVGAINYFTGNIRNVSIKENIDDSTLTLVVASHWSNWNLTKGRHFSDESQQAFSSGDKGMEFATQVKEDVRWGM